MTGYGKSTCELEGKKLTFEVRSLNSKQLDLNTRIPGFYKEKELEIRTMLSRKLQRGKVEFNLFAEITGSDNATSVNKEVVKSYYHQLNEISKENNIAEGDILGTILRLPDTLKTVREELDDAEWKQVLPAIEKAIDSIVKYRQEEGVALEKDILERIASIESLLAEVEPLEKPRIERIKSRISNNLAEFIDMENIDKNRLEQELIFYIEKLDITEEKVRLANHCKYFVETAQSDEPVGKKLGFISQEIGREINTLGSKANDADMQKLVIRMKDELEKIKEQLLNIL
jgi:uncharacterized protein (TIGR00255 family)